MASYTYPLQCFLQIRGDSEGTDHKAVCVPGSLCTYDCANVFQEQLSCSFRKGPNCTAVGGRKSERQKVIFKVNTG